MLNEELRASALYPSLIPCDFSVCKGSRQSNQPARRMKAELRGPCDPTLSIKIGGAGALGIF